MKIKNCIIKFDKGWNNHIIFENNTLKNDVNQNKNTCCPIIIL